MNCLFMIGRGDETDQILTDLLDIETVKTRPEYDMAPGENLILSDCGFEDLQWSGGIYGSHETFNIYKVSLITILPGFVTNYLLGKTRRINNLAVFEPVLDDLLHAVVIHFSTSCRRILKVPCSRQTYLLI